MAPARVTWYRKPPIVAARGLRCIMPCKLASDPPGHPGQWSLVLQLKPDSDRADVTFLVATAPHHELVPGASIDLYEGSKKVGEVEVLR